MIMKLEHYPAEQLQQDIKTIVKKYLDTSQYKVFFFGSRVSQQSHERSDIDIGIEGPQAVPTKALLDIQEEVENLPLLYTIDVVDFANVAAGFRTLAKQHREYIT